MVQVKFRWISIWILSLQITAYQLSAHPLFPYGDIAGDTSILDSTEVIQVNLSRSLQYYGQSYQTIYISKDGLVSMHHNTIYLPQHWRDNPAVHNHPFIAPYYYHGEGKTPDSHRIPGKIYYRVITTSGPQSDLLTFLGQYMINSVVGVRLFKPDIALIVTWEDVTDASTATDGCVSDNSCTQTSTFQLVLLSDRKQTFAIFNYKKMDLPDHPFYQSGMNGGFNNGWTDVFCGDQCGNMNLNLLTTLQGSDVMGRFIFKVSSDVIVRGGCLPRTARSVKPEFYPQYANMYGGEIIDVSGLCVQPGERLTCSFGIGKETTAISFANSTKHRCEVPRLTQRGVIELVIKSGQAGSLTGWFHIVLFSRSDHHLLPLLTNPANLWNETTPEELGMEWHVTPLGGHRGATVDINLIGYREDADGIYWEKLDVLGSDILAAEGKFSFKTTDHKCTGKQCWEYEIGIVEVLLPQKYWTDSTRYGSYTYGVVPLGWFVHDYMVQEYGNDYSSDNCKAWYEKDKKDVSWQEELLACPCNLYQAVTDFGRWQPDVGCNVYTGSSCHYHKGAIHCVRSVTPTKSGAGNQCCYRADGGLKYAADSYQGSTPDRGHDWGAPPYNQPNYVPSLSHWIHDVISFYHCCLWVAYSQCDYYMEQRPTRDCKNYNPPKTAFIYGDPHVTTFDGRQYDFPGKGEFWLVQDDKLSIQGRFDQITHVNVTALVGVAIHAPGSSKVEIRFTSPGHVAGRVLNVIIDGIIRVFGKASNTPEWQDFKGVSVTQNRFAENNDDHSNFTVLLQSGVGVQVAAVGNLLHLTVVIPELFKETTKGLLGNWDDDLDNEFKLPSGALVSTTNSTQDIYTRFGLMWGVHGTNGDSLFQFSTGFESNYMPLFTKAPLADGVNPFTIRQTCVEDHLCIHDYRITGSRRIGLATLQAVTWIRTVQSFQTKVLTCGLLGVPGSVKNSVNYTLGSKITISSCKTGSLSGSIDYKCIRNIEGDVLWDPEVTASCNGGTKEGNISMIVGITVPVVVVIIVIIIIIVIMFRRKPRKPNHKESDLESVRDPATRTALVPPIAAPRTVDNSVNDSKTSEASL